MIDFFSLKMYIASFTLRYLSYFKVRFMKREILSSFHYLVNLLIFNNQNMPLKITLLSLSLSVSMIGRIGFAHEIFVFVFSYQSYL